MTIENHSPVAVFEATIVGADSVIFDASLSYDPEDSTRLSYRWGIGTAMGYSTPTGV